MVGVTGALDDLWLEIMNTSLQGQTHIKASSLVFAVLTSFVKHDLVGVLTPISMMFPCSSGPNLCPRKIKCQSECCLLIIFK